MQCKQKPTRYYSRRQEKKVASNLNMRTTPNSGATAFSKGDVTDDRLLLECKTLTKKQKTRTIEKEWLTSIKEEQFQMRKELSGVVFDFGDGENYVILTMNDFKNLYEIYKEAVQ